MTEGIRCKTHNKELTYVMVGNKAIDDAIRHNMQRAADRHAAEMSRAGDRTCAFERIRKETE